jgi:tetratricopeptide (TPR) repeat protein
MFPGEDLLQEGIAAFQAGDRAKAHDLLEQVVEIDPENEQAWYYLAASESDPTLRMAHLEHVLDINPGNAKAREVLERIKSRAAQPETVGAETAAPRAAGNNSSARIRSLDPSVDAPGASGDEAGSFKIPFNIPGAPARTTWETLARDGVALLRGALDIVLRKPGFYESEVRTATWWRFWLIAGTAAVASALISIVNALFLVVRFSASLSGIIAVLLTPFFFVAVGLVALYAGSYLSHQYALRQGGAAARSSNMPTQLRSSGHLFSCSTACSASFSIWLAQAVGSLRCSSASTSFTSLAKASRTCTCSPTKTRSGLPPSS